MMKNAIPRVAAIHDLSGIGRVALGVVIPILTSMGVQVTPLPTAVLSSNTHYDGFKMLDLTPQMQEFIEHWKRENIFFEGIYSGFLGSAQQIDIVRDFIRHFRREDQLVVVDPVLGDDGVAYTTMTPEIISGMRSLVCAADVITPNITEVCLLTDSKYRDDFTTDEIKDFCRTLANLGPENVIITGIMDPHRADITSVVAYNKKTDKYWKVSCSYIPAFYPGTGDIFASVITGSLLQGDSLVIALDRAVHFISIAVRTTYGREYIATEGVLIEKVLDTLKAPLTISTYEII